MDGKIGAKDLLAIKPNILESLKEAITFDLILEIDPSGNAVRAIPKIHDQWTDGLNLGDISNSPGLEKYIGQEKNMANLTEAEVNSLLVKMADKFDQEGKHDLAAEVDEAIISMSSRKKAPLKKLDDETKKSLIIFIHDADKSTQKSSDGLKELFRRLRYFDLAGSVKDLGLDKILKDMERTQGCLHGAKGGLFELMHGKKPSKKDLEDLFAEDDCNDGSINTPLDFFEQHSDDGEAYDDFFGQDSEDYISPEDESFEEEMGFLNDPKTQDAFGDDYTKFLSSIKDKDVVVQVDDHDDDDGDEDYSDLF